MTDDIDGLRAVLRERAAGAHDPEALLAATHQGVRRHRRRQRTGTLIGAVGVTTCGLLAAVVLAHTSALAPRPATTGPAAASTPAQVPLAPPSLPFSISSVPTGYHPGSWFIEPTDLSLQYVDADQAQTITVQLRTADPSIGLVDAQRTTVHGAPAVLGSLAATDMADRQLSWQFSPGHWLSVAGHNPAVSDATLRLVADAVTAKPTTLTSTVIVPDLPAGWSLRSWQWSPQAGIGEFVSLCPTRSVTTALCVELHPGNGTAPTIATDVKPSTGPEADHLHTVLLHKAVYNGVTLLVTADGQTAERQIDPGHWIAVVGATADPTMVRLFAETATVG
ncbi:MAG TPA: hypothetical protein VHW44_27250 [Pseudonocardiaceae bacterium]|jgi:hypothetical protein|nr:hypothetical protein [Pseudonocardiaceae bacterium]